MTQHHDTPRTDAARIGELERELQSLSNRLENMTQSRDCMIEDRNLLEVEVARLRDEAQSWKKHAFTLRDEVAWFSERLNRAIEIGKTLSFSHCYDCQKDNCSLCNLVEELAKLKEAK